MRSSAATAAPSASLGPCPEVKATRSARSGRSPGPCPDRVGGDALNARTASTSSMLNSDKWSLWESSIGRCAGCSCSSELNGAISLPRPQTRPDQLQHLRERGLLEAVRRVAGGGPAWLLHDPELAGGNARAREFAVVGVALALRVLTPARVRERVLDLALAGGGRVQVEGAAPAHFVQAQRELDVLEPVRTPQPRDQRLCPEMVGRAGVWPLL